TLMWNFMYMYMSINLEQQIAIGYEYDEFIMDCEYMGIKCSEEDFYQILDPSYGVCYTFNHQGDQGSTGLTGSLNSFYLVLNIQQPTYLPRQITQKAGARLVIHKTNTGPITTDEGIDLTPNMASSIAISENDLTRLEKPYEAQCMTYWNETDYSPGRDSNDTYSLLECQRICMQENFLEKCGCGHPLYTKGYNYKGTYKVANPTCNLTKESTNYECVTIELKAYAKDSGYLGCSCKQSCSQVQYPFSVSGAKWPTSPSKSSVSYEVIGPMEDNLLALNVYFKSLNTYNIEQEADYEDWSDIVSSLGGALSLYLGISIILVFEVLEFLIYLIINTGLYCVGNYQSKSSDVPRPLTPSTLKNVQFLDKNPDVPRILNLLATPPRSAKLKF
ncbi:unnamed protein product, partial [Meganyctiphanes norvegica]